MLNEVKKDYFVNNDKGFKEPCNINMYVLNTHTP